MPSLESRPSLSLILPCLVLQGLRPTTGDARPRLHLEQGASHKHFLHFRHRMLLHRNRLGSFAITQPRFCVSQTLREAAAVRAVSTANRVHSASKLISTFTAIRDTERASDRAQEEPGSSWPPLLHAPPTPPDTTTTPPPPRVPSRTRAASPADTATLPPPQDESTSSESAGGPLPSPPFPSPPPRSPLPLPPPSLPSYKRGRPRSTPRHAVTQHGPSTLHAQPFALGLAPGLANRSLSSREQMTPSTSGCQEAPARGRESGPWG